MSRHAREHAARTLTGLALVVGALVTTTAGANAAPVACQRTFSSTASQPISAGTLNPLPPFIPLIIPGAGTSTITGVAPGTASDVDVIVNITHPALSLLSLSLSDGSVSRTLESALSLTGTNLTGTTFDDEATQSLTSALSPYTGSFLPTDPLSAYDGTAVPSTWTLNVGNVSLLPGTIDSWAVRVTYAGTCNYDGDSVEDHSDKCPNLAGASASGCPLASRGLTAKYRHGRFKGVLSSSVSACRASKSVTVWKVRKGPDRKIGTKLTRSDGRYKLKRARHRGKYYATSPRVVVAGVAECPSVRSPRFRIR